MVYTLLLLLTFLPYILKKRVRNIEANNTSKITYKLSNKISISYFIIVPLTMILLLTLKHDLVGTDTQNYRWLYDTFGNISFKTAMQHINDVGFVLTFQLLSRLGLGFRGVLFLQALFYISSVTIIIRKYSKMPAGSYWIFITFGYLIFATTMRQAIATAFILLSYELLRKRKMVSFIVCVLIASTFHLTALIFLPAYWINKFRYNRKTLILIISIITLIILLKERISLFILSFSKTEYPASSTGGYFLILFLFVLLLLGIIYHKNFIENNEDNKMLFFMIAVALALIPIAKINPAVFRITYYYQIFMILYIPNLIASIHDKLMKSVLTYGFLILGIYYFYYKLGDYGIWVHPYVFYWNEFPIKIPGLN